MRSTRCRFLRPHKRAVRSNAGRSIYDHYYEKGSYRIVIEEQNFEGSTSTGNRRLFVLYFRVLGRYNAQGKMEHCPRLQRMYRQTLNGKGFSIIKADLKALGVKCQASSSCIPRRRGTSAWLGERAIFLTTTSHPRGEWSSAGRCRRRMSRDAVERCRRSSATCCKTALVDPRRRSHRPR